MESGSHYAYIGNDEEEEMELDNNEMQMDAPNLLSSPVAAPAPAPAPSSSSKGGSFFGLFGRSSSTAPSMSSRGPAPGNGAPLAPPPPPAPVPKSKVTVKKSNTNILNINLGTLSNESSVATGDPIFCSSCRVVFSNINNISTVQSGDGKSFPNVPTSGGLVDNKWTCEFCGEITTVNVVPEEIPKSNIVDYVLEAPNNTANNNNNNNNVNSNNGEDESYVIFCIDISGSMQITYQVPDDLKLRGGNKPDQNKEHLDLQRRFGEGVAPVQKKKITYVSRLQCVQYGIEAQLETLQKESPNRRVGIVAFSHEVVIIGDGSNKPVTIAGDKLNNVDELVKAGASIELATPISKSRSELEKKVFDLEPNGSTSLGPAIAVAIGMANRVRGSKIVLCTDGLSNIGVGALEDTPLEQVKPFYNQMSEMAVRGGTTIAVLSIKGAECKMEQLGQLAEATSGEVNIVDPLTMKDDFKNALALPILATNVSIQVKLHRGLYISDPLDPSTNQSFIHKEIGNVNEDTTVSFDYGVNSVTSKKYDLDKLKSLPFQLQITYTTMKGNKCMRVITMTKECTKNQELAEENADIDALGVNMVQTSGKIASTGNYNSSRARNLQTNVLMKKVHEKKQEKLMSAPMSTEAQQQLLKEQKQQQQQWTKHAQNLETQLTSTMKKETSSLPSSSSQLYEQRRAERSDETANFLFNMKSMNSRKAKK